jgi:5-aminolevulinate synthase
MYGDTGAGVADKLGLANDIDIIQGTLGKAYGTIGGYISSTNLICDVIRSYASGFIFTTAIPPALASAANASIQYLKKSKVERTLQQENTILLKKYLYKAKIPFLDNESHIVPVMVYNPKKCKEISNILLNDFGHYIQPINYPTVPMGLERLRITPGPLHNEEMIANLTNALKHAFMKTNEIDYIKSA